MKWVIFIALAMAIAPSVSIGGALEDALDDPALTWTTGGSQPWGAQTNLTLDGVDAARTGNLEAFQESWLETTVSGPGTFSFWWKSASPFGPEPLLFESGDVGQDMALTGVTDWRHRAVTIPEGDHVLRWRRATTDFGIDDDAGYLDRVTWAPGETLYCIDISGVGGVVSNDPPAELYAPGSMVALTAAANTGKAFIGWSGDASGSDNPLVLTIEANLGIKALFGNTNAPDAAILESTNLTFSTGGDAPWEGASDVTHDGEDAARCGWLTAGQESWMTAEVMGPGVLSFWWKSSYYLIGEWGDKAEFLVDGNACLGTGGEQDWTQQVVEIGEGTHRLMWRFSKIQNTSSGDNRIWVDQVSWYPGFWWTLTLDAGEGTVETDPHGIELEPGVLRFEEYSEVLLTAIPPPGQKFVRWAGDASGSDNPMYLMMDGNKGVVAVFGQSNPAIEAALDNTNLAFTVGGDALWTAQSGITHDGEDAAQSGAVGDYGQSWLETSVAGPGVLTFWWKVSCESPSWKQLGPNHSDFSGDALKLIIDGNLKTEISGEVNWARQFIVLPAGEHIIRWQYTKDLNGDFGQDMGWLDEVAFTPGVTVEEALDCEGLTWSRSTSPQWIGQTVETSDGQDAAATDLIPPGQTAWIETEIDGPKFVHYAARAVGANASLVSVFTISGQTNGAAMLIDGQPWADQWGYVAPGHQTLRWQFENLTDSAKPATALLDAIEIRNTIPIEQALDAPDWTWQSDTNGQWTGQYSVTHDGEDAVKTTMDGAAGTRWLETIIEGPGIMEFWWRLSGPGRFTVLVDGLTNAVLAEASTTWKRQGSFIPAGTHTIRWEPSGGLVSFFGYLDEVAFSSMSNLANAVEAPELSWSTTGNAAWYPQTNVAVIDGDAARSGATIPGQQSAMETSITGPAIVDFWWKVSSEAAEVSTNEWPLPLDPGDVLELWVAGNLWASISGEVDWQGQSITLPSGNHTVRWRYAKDSDGDVGQDAGWVDGVHVQPPVALGDATDAPGLTWATGSTGCVGEWVGQAWVSSDGHDAVECVLWSTNQFPNFGEAWMETTVTGPGRIAYKFKPKASRSWAVGWAGLSIEGGASSEFPVSGDWGDFVLDVPPGERKLRWTLAEGRPGGWLDQVVWRTDVMYSHWLSRHFSDEEIANPSVGGFHADPDGDGASNGLESALGTDPRIHDTPPGGMLPSCSLPLPPGASDRLKLVFNRAEEPPYDVTLLIQVSSTLEPDSWTTIAQKTGMNGWAGSASISEEAAVDGRVRVTAYDTVIAQGYARRFMRVVASQSAP